VSRAAARRTKLATLLAVACLAGAASSDDELPPSVAWVKAHAHPLSTVEAGHGFEDLAFLEKAIGDARVVGLGEATHGTREHFQMKHRLLEFLATKMGFTVFAIEANMPESYRVDRYVSGGEGDPAALIGGMYFWTWNTEEVLDMVKWMRAFNEREAAAKSGRHVRFTGFDMQMADYSRTIVRRFVEKHDPEFLPELDARWKKVAAAQRTNRSTFGCASVLLPIERLRGKKVRFEGFIRTEGVAVGWAGLWARVNAGGAIRFFDNMAERGATDTTPWRRYAVEFTVAADATAVQVGTVFSGAGRAWFDCLQVAVDGALCDEDAFADPSFEKKPLGPFVAGFALERYDPARNEYSVGAETAEALDGTRCLVMAATKRAAAATAPADAVEEARAVAERLAAGRARYVAAGAAPVDVEWAARNAEVVRQCAVMCGAADTSAARDEAMAANVRWMLDDDPSAKVVVWAHNFHVSSQPNWMGAHLKKSLGASYVTVGFMAGSGTYYAMGPASDGAAEEHVHRLKEPVEGGIEWIFRKAGEPLALLDLRGVDAGAPGAAWTRQKRDFGHIGAMRRDERFDPIVASEAFDLLLYVDQTTAARQLKTPPARTAPKD
jgi:erythromycin esterase-like protein